MEFVQEGRGVESGLKESGKVMQRETKNMYGNIKKPGAG